MIQRIQSVFLLVVIACGVCLLIFPFVSYEGYPPLFLHNPIDLTPLGNYLSILNALLCLFMYKKRKIQVKLCYLIIVFNSCLFLTILFLTNQLYNHDFEKKTFLFPAYLPIVAIVAAFIASRYIKKDEELVRSADRIR
jgi:peptidoglycan/LPS O-acetylase OafA/YrhL